MGKETIEIEGWKGKDEISIVEVADYYEVVEHRKDKLSGEVGRAVHKIPKANVEKILVLIVEHCPSVAIGTTYRKLIPSIIETYHLPIEIEEFNGGKNRSKYYFPLYYYPLKILEKQGFIRYGGRGKIVRLR